ncbi:CMRF35-like molecule 5 isoform X3 [Dicentrarchus labrax]|uniref:CMRF35-like molecule 5 isoform X3 n=1 Tax=Dicentrarchus labrax TaxID=13489 RepID=UPI0021F668C9|nr:CMRF35-like molecule 5 isoform X3 [Dicentrarchus labrax]
MMYVYSCLLCALSVVAVEPLNLNGHVGKNVTFKCSDWNVWAGVKSNVKYLCDNPCSENKHIIIKAEYGKTAHENRIELTNRAEGLFVTFTNLQKSDSKKYYCGVERFGPDPLIEVNLKVIDESPKNTPATFAVTSSSTVSSSSSDSISAMSTSYIIHCTTTTAPATQRSADASRADTPQEDMREEVEYDKIRPEDQQTACQPAGVSTLSFSADPDSLYANYSSHQGTELAFSRVTFHQCDLVYSVIPLPSDQSEPNQSESNTNDSLYSMAQLPQAT